MNLSYFLTEYSKLSLPQEIRISNLALDSRLVQPGDLFFALSGTHLNGRQFIEEAIQKGASAILTEGDEFSLTWRDKIPIISIPELKKETGKLAAKFYDYPAKKMRMIGVTGTSGKTSCTQFIAALLHHLKISCGVIGTLGNGLFGQIKEGNLTTPDAITLQKMLAEFVKAGAKITAMEVSSHSLNQDRVSGIEFDIGIFTNLSRDHLDYHGTMEKYGATKKRLFDQANYAVINADDAFGRELLDAFTTRKHVFSYSSENKVDIYADNIQLSSFGIKAIVVTPWGSADLISTLVGPFNLSNLLAVISALGLLEIPLFSIIQGIRELHPIVGRMQSLGGGKKPLVVIDYAHKPDPLEKVLIALRQQCQGKLYCIFGCGGDRDRGKRPMMAQIAEQYADQVIVTDDNPRFEDPAQIVQDIMQGFTEKSRVIVEHDRAKAIHDIIQLAKVGDCVLIAGKGSETYQQIKGQKIPFSDIDTAKEALGL